MHPLPMILAFVLGQTGTEPPQGDLTLEIVGQLPAWSAGKMAFSGDHDLAAQARAILDAEGEDGLIFAPAPFVKGKGTDKSMRAIVGAFAFAAKDVTAWWVLAHRFDAELRYRRGTLWSVDMGSVGMMAGIAETAENGAKRALALSAVARTHWGDWRGLLMRRLREDPDARVRAMAASLLPALAGIPVGKALPLVKAMHALLDHESPGIRAAAVRGLARCAYRPEDIARVDLVARTDEDPEVRVVAVKALASLPSLEARDLLIAIARDAGSPAATRAAATKTLREEFVVPDDL